MATAHYARAPRGMELDSEKPVVALCAEGMARGGDAAAAADCFRRAWALRADDCDAAVAAHYLARVQPDAAGRLAWDACAVRHAEAARAAGDGRVRALLASLYLNLGDGLLAAGRRGEALDAARRAEGALAELPEEGYRAFVAAGVARLLERARAEPNGAAI